MIEGFVNANLEAVVTLPVRGPAGRTQEVAAAVGVGALAGMRLLDGHSLYMEVEDGGRVIIERR